MRTVTLLCLLLALLGAAVACDKGETRDDQAPTSQPASTPADAQPDAGAAPTLAADAGAAPEKQPDSAPAAPVNPHAEFDGLLKKFVTEQGGVKYKDWKADPASVDALKKYVAWAAEADPAAMKDKDRLAFYINAYNANTLLAVLDRYPLKSVLDVKGFFDAIKYKVGKEELTLNGLEGDKIRKPFGEPRIHFVVNCASGSCPILRRDAITADNMEGIMEEATRAYVLQETTVNAKKKTVDTSKIFEWYKDDFTASGGVGAFLAKYLPPANGEIAKTGKVTTHEYKWNLNEAP